MVRGLIPAASSHEIVVIDKRMVANILPLEYFILSHDSTTIEGISSASVSSLTMDVFDVVAFSIVIMVNLSIVLATAAMMISHIAKRSKKNDRRRSY